MKIFDFESEPKLSKVSSSSNPLIKEFSEYQNVTIGEKIDVLDWWDKNQNKFLILSQMVRQTFCCPATSVPSVRVFSSSGYTVWDRRNQLQQLKLDKMRVINQFFRNNFLNNTLKNRD